MRFILQTTNGRVPLKFLKNLQATALKKRNRTGSNRQTFTFKFSSDGFHKGFTQEEFEEWVRGLPTTVYRMKGYVPIEGMQYPMLFQYAYGLVQWIPEYMNMPPKIVMIGEDVQSISVIREKKE